jgi:mannose-6-phosphate isomerase-like protein (cupin superfamily)
MNTTLTEKNIIQLPQLETVSHQGKVLCLIVRRAPSPDKTTFFTDSECNLQVGKIVYPKDGIISRHDHRPVERHVSGTSEVLIVEKGHMIADIYTDDRQLHSSHELCEGDVVVLLAGGHGFRLLEDTILIEVKQGPYSAQQDKERF